MHRYHQGPLAGARQQPREQCSYPWSSSQRAAVAARRGRSSGQRVKSGLVVRHRRRAAADVAPASAAEAVCFWLDVLWSRFSLTKQLSVWTNHDTVVVVFLCCRAFAEEGVKGGVHAQLRNTCTACVVRVPSLREAA